MLKPLLAAAAVAAFAAAPARAESWNTCAGFIEALPAVITTQGTWCLSRDLSTSATSGSAIAIEANNVTIDCNGFKLGGLAAGPETTASGIRATDRLNVTVRNCNIRGFRTGVSIVGYDSAGHLIEDNRFDGNLHSGIAAAGDAVIVRRNHVVDTGGNPGSNFATGISVYGSADVIDNAVHGVTPGLYSDAWSVMGIYVSGAPTLVQGNRVRGLAQGTGITSTAISAGYPSGRVRIIGNQLFGTGAVGTAGIRCHPDGGGSITGNYVADFATDNVNCALDSTGNVFK
jgi:hypothetical protein